MELYPLLMTPYFRHGAETPWGGSMLSDVFLKDAPDERTGESLEISALPGCESVVRNGVYAGKNLAEMLEIWGGAAHWRRGGDAPAFEDTGREGMPFRAGTPR